MGTMTKHAKDMHDKMASHDENDKWQSTNEIDTELKNNGGFSDPLGGDGYNTFEEQALPQVLDGEVLTQEIGGNTLTQEIMDETKGAGIHDKDELADLLKSVKGAQVFMNKTPKE